MDSQGGGDDIGDCFFYPSPSLGSGFVVRVIEDDIRGRHAVPLSCVMRRQYPHRICHCLRYRRTSARQHSSSVRSVYIVDDTVVFISPVVGVVSDDGVSFAVVVVGNQSDVVELVWSSESSTSNLLLRLSPA